MSIFPLPCPLPAEPVLWQLNRDLQTGGGPLDWSQLQLPEDLDGFRRSLAVLLAGLDLADDADTLGLETVPDPLQQILLEVLESQPKRSKRRYRTPRPGTRAALWQREGGQQAAKVLAPPKAVVLRDELEQMVIRDLLGPAGGPEEEVAETSVQERYLVGTLAPKQQRIQCEEHESHTRESLPSPEDGSDDVTTPQADSMFPSSIGMSFCVEEGSSPLQVMARYGRYERKPSSQLFGDDGSPRRVWKRVQVEGCSPPIPLAEGPIDPWEVDSRTPGVSVRGSMRRLDGTGDLLVTLFLVNGQEEPAQSRDTAWLFQPELTVRAEDGSAPFVRRPLGHDETLLDPLTLRESRAMAMLYRHQVEFAVGHNVAVHATPSEESTQRAVSLETRVVPVSEVRQQTPPTVRDLPLLSDLVLDMKLLAETPRDQLEARLRALPQAYQAWIEEEERRGRGGQDGLEAHQEPAYEALDRCRIALERIRDGVSLLASNRQAAQAFAFANKAMYLQRLHSILAERRRRGDKKVTLEELDIPENRTWYAFQLGFVLLNLTAVTDLHHRDRTHETEAIADLLWFPTGGGKTEAYLGLAAYVMGLRRLQGDVAGRSGEHGVAVLMRYTLRLLTLQQFQRAATLICACEVIRKEAAAEGEPCWGHEPFRIGLWVGMRTTPNTTAQAAEWLKSNKDGRWRRASSIGGTGSPAQLTFCPWCGAPVDPGRDIVVESYSAGVGRTWLYCGDKLGRCPFTKRQNQGEGIPVVVVDEEIYRRLPSLLIATVDKFAQMPWNGVVQTLFGQVKGRCTRHGFRSPDLQDADSHPRRGRVASARTVDHPLLRPPDLIIQDELHLISGPLGTLTGLYETAVDHLCSWEVGGRRIRPKVVASTATIRRADDQVHQLFLRKVAVFPPHGTGADDNFFSIQRNPREVPGRRYMGICAPGRRVKAAQIRVFVALLAAAQTLYQRHGKAADPWMTLVGYFNAMRELAGARRLVEDDVRMRLRDTPERGLAKRLPPIVEELTSRKGSSDIPRLLDLLEVRFDPEHERRRKQEKRRTGRYKTPRPLDVLLATNMISVGVDVKRLGLMVVTGQPKTTAEYIQATSRVGRKQPGLVCTLYNWARPRDLSHYETFEHYHETFYQHVEALSVTPFAPRAIDRGLSALLVSLVRLPGVDFNPNHAAHSLEVAHALVQAARDRIARRAACVSGSNAVGDEVSEMVQARLDLWMAEIQRDAGGSTLGYKRKKDGSTRALLQRAGDGPWQAFTCLNSLRDVEAPVPLLLDESGMDEGSVYRAPPSDPASGGAE